MVLKSIQLNIKSRFENVSLVGLAVNRICAEMAFSENDVYQMELCIVEACNNVIEHAYANQPDEDIDIQISQHLDCIVFNIIDSGKAMPISWTNSSLEFDPTEREQLPEGGMGLFLIREIMNKVEYRNLAGRNVLTLTKYCNNERRN